jgi:uncharacterized protein (TIGR03000 family)
MKRTPMPLLLVLTGLALTASPPLALGQEGTAHPANLTVMVPADAQLTVDGVKTTQKGETRKFISPPLQAGKRYVYTLRATWMESGKEVEVKRDVRVEAGKETKVDLREEEKKPNTTADKPPKKDADKPKNEEAAKKPAKLGKDGDRAPDVVFWPSPQAVVDKMLEMAKVTDKDTVIDPGCGDAIILVTAAKKYGAKGYGCDIDPERIKDSEENIKKNKVEKLVTVEKADMFKIDFTPATVVTLYLLPDLNVKLMPQLAKCKPGTRIVSHDFSMAGAKPVKVEKVTAVNHMGQEGVHTIYMWIVPWEKE